jgi:hypothetical protein
MKSDQEKYDVFEKRVLRKGKHYISYSDRKLKIGPMESHPSTVHRAARMRESFPQKNPGPITAQVPTSTPEILRGNSSSNRSKKLGLDCFSKSI